jgi:hypothetical protein
MTLETHAFALTRVYRLDYRLTAVVSLKINERNSLFGVQVNVAADMVVQRCIEAMAPMTNLMTVTMMAIVLLLLLKLIRCGVMSWHEHLDGGDYSR